MAGNATKAGRVAVNTMTANTADLIVLTDGGFSVKVTNVTGTAPIWFTVSHPGGACPVPTVGGANCYIAGSVAGQSVNVRHSAQFGSVIQLISAGTPTYMVEVQGNHATS